jgi:intracellular sulfur oxidation DsrE/DsrF family protein
MQVRITNPPDKRKKIRAFQTLRHLTRTYHVHVVCSARSHAEMTAERELAARCQFGGTAHEGLCVDVCGTAVASQTVSNRGGGLELGAA